MREECVCQAIRIRTPELRILDFVHFENYQAVAPKAGYGFSVYGQKRIGRRLSVGTGYAQHDRPGLYSDRFAEGKRLFWNALWELYPQFSLSAQVTQAIRNAELTNPRTRMNLALNYNLLALVRKTGLF